jgi:hypothetical protein
MEARMSLALEEFKPFGEGCKPKWLSTLANGNPGTTWKIGR